MPLVLSLIARKGGVGKTSTALNLAGAALDDGLTSVVLVDLDSQASLTRATLGGTDGLRLSDSVQALADGIPAEQLLKPTQVSGVSILPAHSEQRLPSGTVLQLASLPADLVILDTPPDTANPAVRSALLASDAVISPVVPEAWGLQSLHGVSQLLMSASSNQALTFCGWLPSMLQPRLGIHQACLDILKRLHGSGVYEATLPHATAFKEASAAGQPVTHTAKRTAAAKAVRAVWAETLDRLEAAAQRRHSA